MALMQILEWIAPFLQPDLLNDLQFEGLKFVKAKSKHFRHYRLNLGPSFWLDIVSNSDSDGDASTGTDSTDSDMSDE